ncbi:MAG TPA: hypothetical protein VE566_00275 [Nitrososphaeraceae archaeon]|jgi:hypothetical protein|nr:hypothetical protein [Nitrososphaeraceae archaeon]
MQSALKSRPLGIAILNIVGGVFMLGFGIGFIMQDAVLQPLHDTLGSAIELPPRNLTAEQASIPGFGIALGGVLVPLAIVSFIVASGLLKGRRWAWIAALVLSIIGIGWYAITIATVPSNGGRTVGIIIGAVIIYYLYRPHVKANLGKGVR